MFQFEMRPGDIRVDIGMPVGTGYMPFPTVAALVDTIQTCTTHGIKTRLISPVGCSLITDARSAVVDEFLKGDATHLFWIDADMHWHPKNFLRLLALGTQVDVVGAAYCPKVEPVRFMIRWPEGKKFVFADFGLMEVLGLGLGFCVMKRAVVERVAATKEMVISNGGKVPMRDVFALRKVESGHRLGEDMGFFQDIRDAGYKVWMDPETDVNHVGFKLYGGRVMDAVEQHQLEKQMKDWGAVPVSST